MPNVQLTTNFINTGLTCPDGQTRIEYCDADRTGLYVEVRSTNQGKGTYYLRYKDEKGKTCHQKIGRTDDMTVTEAKKAARDLKAQIRLGSDPRADAKAKKAVPTFTEFFRDSYLPYAKQHKRSWVRDEQLFRLRVEPAFGHLRLHEVKRQAVQNFLGAMDKEGIAKATADHHVKLIRQMLNRAVEWEVIQANPISRIKLFNADNKKERYLEDEELARVLKVLRTDTNRGVCNATMFLLATGARLNEALSAKLEHIDRENKMWRIPASNSKSKRVRSVPLNEFALALIDALGVVDRGDYLFVSGKTGKPLKYVHKVWERLRGEAGLPDLRIHDLRHQFASFLINDRRTLYEVQQILGHSSHSVTERYAHLSKDSLRAASNSASVKIQEALAGVA